MKRDFSTAVLNYDRNPIVRSVFKHDEKGMPLIGKDGNQVFSHHEPLTYRLYAMDALAGRWRGEDSMTVDEAHRRMKLHDKLCCSADGVVELDGKEGQMILDCLLKQGREALVIGRMKDLLDTDPKVE